MFFEITRPILPLRKQPQNSANQACLAAEQPLLCITKTTAAPRWDSEAEVQNPPLNLTSSLQTA